MVTLRSQDGVAKDKGVETEVPMEQRLSRMEEMMEGLQKAQSNISRQLSELMAAMNRSREDKLCDDRSSLDCYSPSSQKEKGSESDNMAEHGTVNLVPEAQEENPNVENHKGCEQTVILEKESIPQSQVPITNSEILKSIEPGKVDLGLEKLEHVVMNENLEQDWVQKNVKPRFEADGDVERGEKVISNTKICSAHQLFVQMPSMEKRSKHIKTWKFKFKLNSKRSKLMDDMLSFMEETSLLNKDPKETSWDMKFQVVLIDDVLSVMVCLRMDETSSDLLLLNGKENEGCLNGSQALVLMKGITESWSRIEEWMKEEPDFVKVNEVKKEKQKQRKCSKSWMYKFKMDSEPAGTSYLKRHKECGICAQIRREKKQSKLLLLSLCPSFIGRAMLRVTVKQRKHPKTWSFKYKQQGNFRLLRCVGERTKKDIVTVTSCRSYGLGKKFLLLNLEVKVSLRGKI